MTPLPRIRSLVQLLVAAAVVVGVLAAPSPAFGHNSFVSSDPASGATLTIAPAQVVMRFASAVPLESASVQVIDSSGTRTDATPLSHGPGGDIEVVAPMPARLSGEITVRWRLVGPDGHPLSDRIVFTVVPPTSTTVAAASAPSVVASSTTAPVAVLRRSSASEPYSTPPVVRWLLRYAAYLAIMTLVGVVLTDVFVWPGSARHPAARRVLNAALLTIVVTATLQFAALAADIGGQTPPSLRDLEAAGQTSTGAALVIRLILAGCAGLLLHRMRFTHADVRWSTLGLTGAALMATWAFAGHSASQRWPQLGVPVDVLHHVAAALWIAALAIVGIAAATTVAPPDLPVIFQRMSRCAAVAVALIVITGVVQAVRLVGSPTRLFAADHGRYLVAKLVVLGFMLGVANLNRRRVALHIVRQPIRASSVRQVRRSILLELAFGLVIIGITAALVVSPPAAGG